VKRHDITGAQVHEHTPKYHLLQLHFSATSPFSLKKLNETAKPIHWLIATSSTSQDDKPKAKKRKRKLSISYYKSSQKRKGVELHMFEPI
jgi:hypothetical protein